MSDTTDPKPAHLRVTQAGTDYDLSLPTEHVEAADEGAYTVLDESAYDESGGLREPDYKTPAADQTATEKAPQKPTPQTGRKADAEKEKS